MRPPCSEKDYFQIHAACDSEGRVSSLRRALFSLTAPPPSITPAGFLLQTQVLYRWVEPKICVENTTGAVALPPMGQREPCPPCNPGYHNSNDSTCLPCPPGTHSDGTNGNPGLFPRQHQTIFICLRKVHGRVLDNRICSTTCKHGGGNISLVLKYGFLCLRPRMHCVSCGYRASAGL